MILFITIKKAPFTVHSIVFKGGKADICKFFVVLTAAIILALFVLY